MASETMDDVFARTLLDDYDADDPWRAVHALRSTGSREVFERSVEWCCSEDALKRARGADILAQFGKTADHPSNLYPEESFTVVSKLVRTETVILPLRAAIYSSGHIGNPQSVPLLVEFQTHPDPEIRFALACALGHFTDNPSAVGVLLQLTRDTDDDVRDWATFGLGAQGKMDTPEIRDALVDRLADSSEDVRHEAMVGLGRMKDRRVLSSLLISLEKPSVAEITIDAASEMLGLENATEGWKAKDYAAALREKFDI